MINIDIILDTYGDNKVEAFAPEAIKAMNIMLDAAREDGVRIAIVFVRDIIPVSQRTEQLNHVIGELEMFYANYGTDPTTYEEFNNT